MILLLNMLARHPSWDSHEAMAHTLPAIVHLRLLDEINRDMPPVVKRLWEICGKGARLVGGLAGRVA